MIGIMKIHLDNCCYNRPYDDQSQIRINLEAQAKMGIQDMIAEGKVDLVSSFILRYENNRKKNQMVRDRIDSFIERYSSGYIDGTSGPKVLTMASGYMKKGLDPMDSAHIACAVLAGCNYFITVDDGVLKHRIDGIEIIDPVQFIRIRGE